MQRCARLQLIGPIALFVVVAAAEATAYALAEHPSSEVLWFLNLEVFGVFRKSRVVLGELGGTPFAQLALAGAPAFAALAGLVFKSRFVGALGSTLTFAYALFVARAWASWNFAGHSEQASLAPIAVPNGYDFWLFLTLGSAAVLSLIASQFVYFSYLRTASNPNLAAGTE